MRATWPLLRRLTALAVVLSWLAGPGRAAVPDKDKDKDPEAALRARALQFNEITGQDAITGQIVALLEDKENSKKLIAAALKLAKEKEKEKDKDPPFNVNATFILAGAANGLKEVEAAEFFYRQHAHQALKLGSSQKFVRAYTGLIDLLYASKKYAEAERVCREFLELKGDENV